MVTGYAGPRLTVLLQVGPCNQQNSLFNRSATCANEGSTRHGVYVTPLRAVTPPMNSGRTRELSTVSSILSCRHRAVSVMCAGISGVASCMIVCKLANTVVDQLTTTKISLCKFHITKTQYSDGFSSIIDRSVRENG